MRSSTRHSQTEDTDVGCKINNGKHIIAVSWLKEDRGGFVDVILCFGLVFLKCILQQPLDELEVNFCRCWSLLFHFNSGHFSQEWNLRHYLLTELICFINIRWPEFKQSYGFVALFKVGPISFLCLTRNKYIKKLSIKINMKVYPLESL